MCAKNRTLRAKGPGPKALASMVSTTVAFALSRGLSLEEITAATGIEGLDIMDPEARLPDEVMPKLWRLLMAHAGEEVALSIEMARAAPFSLLGGLAHGAQFARNVREAFGFLIENRKVLADRLDLTLHETESEAVMVASHPNDVIDRGRTAEVGAAVSLRLVREILGVADGLLRVELPYEAFGSAAAYRAFFGVPVHFGQARVALVFRKDVLEAPVSQANVELFAYVEKHFEQVRRRRARESYPAELWRLREAIVDNAAQGDYGAATAAARARMSLRSAQRLAESHGTTLQALIEEIRASNAKAFLSERDISIEMVALLLGYSDDRAFRRAFKRWTGQAPSVFRKTVKTTPDRP